MTMLHQGSNEPKKNHRIFLITLILVLTLGLTALFFLIQQDSSTGPVSGKETFGDRLKSRSNNNSATFSPQVDKTIILTKLPIAQSTWRSRFPTETIPNNAFQSYLFDVTNPTKIIKELEMKHLTLHQNWGNDFVPSTISKLGAYWIGNVSTSADGIYILGTNFSGDARIIIDGHIIPTAETQSIQIEAGLHTIEVEFVSHHEWAQANLTLIDSSTVIKDREELIDLLSKDIQTQHDVWYAFVDGAYDPNSSQKVKIPSRASKPTILILDSADPIHWDITDAQAKNIAYIFYTSDSIGSSVVSDLASMKVRMLKSDILPSPDGYSPYPNHEATCWTDQNPPRCDNVNTLSNLNKFVREITGGTLTGFTATVDASEAILSIPGNALDEKKRQEIQSKNNLIKNDAEGKALKSTREGTVETLFTE